MKIDHSVLAEISLKASSLLERIKEPKASFIPLNTPTESINKRLERWCQLVADGNTNKFQKRFEWNNLNIEDIKPFLGEGQISSPFSLPSWTKNLRLLIESTANFKLESITSHSLPFPIESNAPLPFEEIWFPTLLVARRHLCDRLKISELSLTEFPFSDLSVKAYQSLERMLLQRLVKLSERTLYEEFCQYRPPIYNGLNLLFETLDLSAQLSSKQPETIYYQSFIKTLLENGLLSLWQKYPVLARLVERILTFWVEATAEFLQRLQTDRHILFQESDHVKEITTSMSDFHNRGRCVFVLTLTSGKKIIYKPKNIGLEIAYNQFLTWCNQKGILLPFKVLNHCDRKTYGWGLDYIEQQPCEDEVAAQHFYQRAGMLLCLLYVFGANDCHYENLIAHGEHFVLIDLETLMHPSAQAILGSSQGMFASDRQLWDSVLRTGLLPRWDFSPDNAIAYDISGLGSINNQKAPYPSLKWNFINTDEVYLFEKRGTLGEGKNLPQFNGVALNPQNYEADLIAGFEQMYGFLTENGQELLENQELQNAFQYQTVRFIFRATYVYQTLLQTTLTPELLQNGVDRSIEIDVLSRTFLNRDEKTSDWGILEAEITAIEQLDIPYFATTANSHALTIGVEPFLTDYLNPGYQRFRERLQNLKEQDLQQQIRMIQGSFAARFPKNNPLSFTSVPSLSENLTFTPDQFLNAAQQIGTKIYQRAIIDEHSQAHWLGLSYVNHTNRFQYQPLGYTLYDGNCGIALFLSALFSITREDKERCLALNALRPLKSILGYKNSDLTAKFIQQIGIGGATGVGSILYGLVKISHLLEDKSWLEEGVKIAQFLSREMIEGDYQLDIMGGSAGAILGLLSLYRETKVMTLLQQAIHCGQILIERRISSEGKPLAWKTIAEKPLTGFSHGAAGISYALGQLYEITGNQDYLKVAMEGIAYERAVFSKDQQNWPDFLTPIPTFKVMWCHGAAGIGFGRLGELRRENNENILQEVKIALETTQKYQETTIDHLCCGNFGRIELLLAAGQVLNRPQLIKIARQNATHLVQQAQKNGGYQIFGDLSSVAFNPGFFQGISGIGYELLRLAYPEKFPVTLLWW